MTTTASQPYSPALAALAQMSLTSLRARYLAATGNPGAGTPLAIYACGLSRDQLIAALLDGGDER